MRWILASLAVLSALSCAPKPGVQLDTPLSIALKADSIRRDTEAEHRDFGRRNAADASNLRAMSVDTLLVLPDSLVLAAGDSVPLYGGPVSWTARTTSGEVVPDYAPWFRVDNSRVLRIRGDMLMALAPGRGALLLTAAVRSDSLPPRILTTSRLVVIVR